MILSGTSSSLVTSWLTGPTKPELEHSSLPKVLTLPTKTHTSDRVNFALVPATTCPHPPHPGYAFLLFRQEVAIHRLLQACLQQDGKFFVFLSSTSLKDKKVRVLDCVVTGCSALHKLLCALPLQVQVRPWFIADSEYKRHPGQGPDPRKTVFIGGVPRPMRACELADIMNERFGHVSYAAIDLDTDVNYPKGEVDRQLTC